MESELGTSVPDFRVTLITFLYSQAIPPTPIPKVFEAWVDKETGKFLSRPVT